MDEDRVQANEFLAELLQILDRQGNGECHRLRLHEVIIIDNSEEVVDATPTRRADQASRDILIDPLRDLERNKGLLHGLVTFDVACLGGWPGRMSLCLSPIRRSSVTTWCVLRRTASLE